ncbi:helix-turn-helix domain-containing protein [Mitsuokella multacida]|uniref:helix-turn-helix domain-containing protein n=1 Tax=Mitsuokella multacida TaxID=52226 RepID=UPI003CFF51BF
MQQPLESQIKLTPVERKNILFFLAGGKPITEIAHLLGRIKSTISHELRRNAAPI